MKEICLVLGLLLFPVISYSLEPEVAQNNYAHELCICSAYFKYCQEGYSRTHPEDELTTARLGEFSDGLLYLSYSLVGEKRTEARYKLAVKDMFKAMDGSIENISVLFNDYEDLCNGMIQNPEARFDYWLNK